MVDIDINPERIQGKIISAWQRGPDQVIIEIEDDEGNWHNVDLHPNIFVTSAVGRRVTLTFHEGKRDKLTIHPQTGEDHNDRTG